MRTVDRWLFAPAPATRLAAFRVLAGGFALVYVIVRLPALWALTRRPEPRFDGVGVLGWLEGPPPSALVAGLLVATLVAGSAFVVGWRFEISGPAFAVLLLMVATFHSSWGQLLHFENLFVLHVLVLGFSPAADAWAVGRGPASSTGHWRYGWPLRLGALITVITYVIASVAKLRIGGTEWLLGDTLQNHVAYSAARLELLGGTPTPLARHVVDQAWLFPPLAVASVALELSAPLALLGGRIRNIWVVAAIAMHLAIAALLAVFFPYQALGFAFAPLFALEVAVSRGRARLVRRSTSTEAIGAAS